MSATESQVFKNGELRPNHPGKPLVFISVFFTIALLSVPLFSQEAEPELPPEEQAKQHFNRALELRPDD
ncbi:MAG: hypothetical protein IH914_11180, partial [candidate division Zixibacteria bacterium]|nr:hypothetical protein [candidate division Zixibacteria bacterium]